MIHVISSDDLSLVSDLDENSISPSALDKALEQVHGNYEPLTEDDKIFIIVIGAAVVLAALVCVFCFVCPWCLFHRLCCRSKEGTVTQRKEPFSSLVFDPSCLHSFFSFIQRAEKRGGKRALSSYIEAMEVAQ